MVSYGNIFGKMSPPFYCYSDLVRWLVINYKQYFDKDTVEILKENYQYDCKDGKDIKELYPTFESYLRDCIINDELDDYMILNTEELN
jgi:hypothetical protein